jgi:exopolyphosphatase/guanosine-5'-triphosphate,3'-diphosphate pyrophosphatase
VAGEAKGPRRPRQYLQAFAAREESMKLGILDIGTNSIHLFLVDLKKDLSIEVLDRAKEFTRLGEASFQEGFLPETAMHRGISTIRRFKKLADIRGVQKIKAVATSAVREAVNGGDFIDLIAQETGIKVRVITGEEEARLITLAVKQTIPMTDKNCLIIDIGGGSVELIVANRKKLVDCWSLKLGTLRLKKEFLKGDSYSKKELKKIEDHIREAMEPVIEKIRKLNVETLIGTSGTIFNLVSMAHWLHHTAPIEIFSNFRIPSVLLLELHEKLRESDKKSRAKMKGLDPQRNDIILPGSAVLSHLLRKGRFEELILCDEAIREGMVYDYLEKNRTKIELESRIPDIRLRSVLELAKKCGYEETHANHVSQLALSLFDQTRSLHQLSPRERDLLRYASLLHDIGYHINYKKHHRHSYYLIKNGDLDGFEEREIELIANIARYHCKSAPKKGHENWLRLKAHDRWVAGICAGILRIADSLDRSHFSVVKEVRCRTNGKQVTMTIAPKGNPELEIWAANKKKDLFEETFNREVFFKHG